MQRGYIHSLSLSVLPVSEMTYTVSNGTLSPSIPYHTLSILTTVFPDGPWLANTRMFQFWFSLELKMMEVVVTTGAIRCPKLVKSSPSTNQHPALYRPHALPIAQRTASKHWRETRIHSLHEWNQNTVKQAVQWLWRISNKSLEGLEKNWQRTVENNPQITGLSRRHFTEMPMTDSSSGVCLPSLTFQLDYCTVTGTENQFRIGLWILYFRIRIISYHWPWLTLTHWRNDGKYWLNDFSEEPSCRSPPVFITYFRINETRTFLINFGAPNISTSDNQHCKI